MSQLNDLNIRQSFYQWLTTTDLVNDFKSGNPDRFDPNKEDNKEWVFIQVKKCKRKKHSKPGQEHYELLIESEVKSRDQSATLGAANMVAKVTSVLAVNQVIPVYDYSDTGEPQVGLIRLHESDSKEGDNRVWHTIIVSTSAVAQNLE